jgi:hypothetical protein
MPRYLWFGLGLLARAVSVLTAMYADWIWHHLVEGAEATLDFVHDLWDFGCWAAGELAGRWSGHDRYQLGC